MQNAIFIMSWNLGENTSLNNCPTCHIWLKLIWLWASEADVDISSWYCFFWGAPHVSLENFLKQFLCDVQNIAVVVSMIRYQVDVRCVCVRFAWDLYLFHIWCNYGQISANVPLQEVVLVLYEDFVARNKPFSFFAAAPLDRAQLYVIMWRKQLMEWRLADYLQIAAKTYVDVYVSHRHVVPELTPSWGSL